MKPRPVILILIFILILLGIANISLPPSSSAQTNTPVYWRYDAPGPLDSILVTDLNHDGFDEFVIVSDLTELMAVDSAGKPLWAETYQAGDIILVVQPIGISGQTQRIDDLIIATGQHIIRLSGDGEEIWRRPLRRPAADLKAITTSDTESPAILVALDDGSLLQFNDQGQIVRQFELTDQPAANASPRLIVTDLDGVGDDEIIFSYFADAGFSKVVLFRANGEIDWERSNSGDVTALSVVEFVPQGPKEIAVATTLNRVYLYNANGARRWPYRSPNRPVTALNMVQLDQGPALLVGTAGGTVIAYDQDGRRYWTTNFSGSADQPILAITSPTNPPSDPLPVTLSVILGSSADASRPSDVLLLDSAGRLLEPSFRSTDPAGLSQLIDLNRDGQSELLLATFATVELLNPGIGARQFFEAWDYRLGAAPTSAIVEDIDLDGEDEILVGTDDGKIHVLNLDGTVLWVADLDGIIADLAIGRHSPDIFPDIVAAHNQIIFNEEGVESATGSIDVLRPDGRSIWNITLDSPISDLLVADINRSGAPELIAGTAEGQVLAFSLTGDEFWRANLFASIEYLNLVNSERLSELIVTTGANVVNRLNIKGTSQIRVAGFLEDIGSVNLITQDEMLTPMILVGVDDGILHSLSPRGNQLWEAGLFGKPETTLAIGNALLVGTDEQELVRIDADGKTTLRLPDIGRLTTLYWGDLDGDIQPDIASGDRNGVLRLMNGDGTETWQKLDLASEVFFISATTRPSDKQSRLIAITDNGVIQSFDPQPNRPPLLLSPQIEVDQGKYTISISVLDVEDDPVIVSLDLFDPQVNSWTSAGEKTATSGADTLFWPISPPSDAHEVRYRFRYDDGTHQGLVEPMSGPPPIAAPGIFPGVLIVLLISIVLVGGIIYMVYQRNSPTVRIRRFYQNIIHDPASTLLLFESEYNQTGGSPDFLLNLAQKARHESNDVVATLADGLFLLSARPESGLPLINKALDEADKLEPYWRHLKEWQATYRLGQSLVLAPTITELSLLHPQLQQLIQIKKEAHRSSDALEGLLPILTTLRDSQRVDLAEDRLIYLNEALGLMRQLQYESRYWPSQIESTLVEAIIDRWFGHTVAEIEELHGRAQLIVRLLTKQLAPGDETIVALEIKNAGRAIAEHIQVNLREDPSYQIRLGEQTLPILSPGRQRQVQFVISPLASEQFRIIFALTYDDRHGQNKRVAFADMVYLLPEERVFSPILNPYSPGMPLRSKSSVFYGRDDLFEFIRENTGQPLQRNVLILIGQRRTGKTSALLRLDQQLGKNLLPVYIDCQSLGVTPGMPALFHDLAWAISDALTARGFEVSVPELSAWQSDPTGLFERHFLPSARQLLSQGTTILLVFDEFEAFENLVNDRILPPTLFTYFRHLMQHGEGLNFIFAGTRRLEEMSSDYWSVLFNTALYRHVGFLSDNAARHLICDPVYPNIKYDDLAIDKILRVTAGHPYFLQLVCYTLVNHANNAQRTYVTISDVNAALDEMLRLGEVHFAYLWQTSSHTEKALLAAAAHQMDYEIPFRPEDLVNFLEQYRINLNPAEITVALNHLVEREILRESVEKSGMLYELRIGLVGLWVANNKSLSHLYDSGIVKEFPKTMKENL